MPDPTKQTISATQAPALFNASPYVTAWMLKRWFIHGDEISDPEHNRMDWGKKMQPLLLAQAAEDLHLEVKPNADDGYVRRGQLGCTRDADIICPSRGPGALETKCCFDHRTWMETWQGGKQLPRHIEIQTQQQMLVGDGHESYQWGVIAVWVCGEQKYFERKPIPELWQSIEQRAAAFFDEVAAKIEGQPFGDSIEAPLLSRLFPVHQGETIDFTAHARAADLAEKIRMLDYHAGERSAHEKGERTIKAMLKALLGSAEEATFLGGIKVRQKQVNRAGYTVKPSSYQTLDVFVPETTAPTVPQTPIIAGG